MFRGLGNCSNIQIQGFIVGKMAPALKYKHCLLTPAFIYSIKGKSKWKSGKQKDSKPPTTKEIQHFFTNTETPAV